MSVLNHLQTVLPAHTIKAVWQALHDKQVLPPEAFLAWQSDDPFRGRSKKEPLNAAEKQLRQHKQNAIIATNSWLQEVQEAWNKANAVCEDRFALFFC